MKPWILICTLSFLLIIGAILSAGFVGGVAEEMHAKVDALPACLDESSEEATQELLEFWKSKVSTVGISVSYLLTDRVCEQAVTLHACAKSGDVYGYEVARGLISDALDDVCRLEKFSIGNLC